MSDMEDRLRAALAARAEQVRPETLRQDPPGPVARPWWRAPGSYGLLAAVAVVVLVVPVGVLALLRGGDGPTPAASPTDDLPLPSPAAGGTWTETASSVGDYDGDGADDVARVLAQDPTTQTGEVRVEVTLAAGGSPVWGVPVAKRPVALADAADVDLDGVPEVLVEVGADPRALVVLSVTGASDLLGVLHDGDKAARGIGEKEFQHHWWVDEDGLWSWVSSTGGKRDADRFLVELTHWLPEDGLRPAPLEVCTIHVAAPEDPADCRAPAE